MLPSSWLNTIWMWKCQPELRAFHRATRSVDETQQGVLRATLRANRAAWIGQQHAFGSIAGVEDFQNRVPLSTYEDYRQPIGRIAAGESGVLTTDRVSLLEPTGGSSGGEKLIPYTPSLRRQFARGVAAWVGDLLRRYPAVRQGRAYWSISPATGPPRRSAGGVPIGFDDDAAYLGLLEQRVLGRLLVVPSTVARIEEIDAFRYTTLLKLLRAEDLSLISVWSPTFLTSLFDSLERWIDRACRDVRRGTLSASGLSPTLTTALTANDRALPRRADQIAAVFRTSETRAAQLREIWPRLSLISCWTDAAAALGVGEVRRMFPHVPIQPKGLLATEGFVSLPLADLDGAALAVRSHFFEFIESSVADTSSTDARRPLLAHQLEAGAVYRVVLTTAGGLYRYQLHDEVQVTGFLNACPLLRFLGKADRTSDLVGEKLHESHVRAVLKRVCRSQGIEPRFALLVPVAEQPRRYRLYLQGGTCNATDASRIQSQLEVGLAENPHYRYAVALGQLNPVEVCFLDPHGASAWQAMERRLLAHGQRAGNIKPTALDSWTGWPQVFQPLVMNTDAGLDRRPRTPRPRPARAR